MDGLEERSMAELMADLLFEALRVPSPALNALAIELFGRCDPEMVGLLLRAALDRKHRPAHRLRALQAVQKVGRLPDATAFFMLLSLGNDTNPGVREAAQRLIATMRQGRWYKDDVLSVEENRLRGESEPKKTVRRRRSPRE
jgi:hypothetical protein